MYSRRGHDLKILHRIFPHPENPCWEAWLAKAETLAVCDFWTEPLWMCWCYQPSPVAISRLPFYTRWGSFYLLRSKSHVLLTITNVRFHSCFDLRKLPFPFNSKHFSRKAMKSWVLNNNFTGIVDYFSYRCYFYSLVGWDEIRKKIFCRPGKAIKCDLLLFVLIFSLFYYLSLVCHVARQGSTVFNFHRYDDCHKILYLSVKFKPLLHTSHAS